MVVDYSQTINRLTQLDAYPLPRIADMVNQIAQYKVYSTIDLKSAYHQLPICREDRPYTAFEADGRLYQFLRVPFGVMNGVSVFQRAIDRMVDQCQLKATFPYLDNITICGHDQQDHDNNVQKFLQAAKSFNLTYNKDKCVFGTTRLAILGKSTTGTTLPSWLTSPGPVLLRKHARSNKYSPIVERVHLLHANPQYAYVVLPDGREDTVSIRDLAPAGAPGPYSERSVVTIDPVPTNVCTYETPCTPNPIQAPHDTPIPGATHTHEGLPTPNVLAPEVRPEPAQPPSPVQSPLVLRRSQRWTRPPDRLNL
ncbi:uncharacterized protein [Mobula birostris]|uniref:uncharacterized protein n=1 Tax=Mobula birostris TaxID=1983395 RepID=UPI003B286DD0